MNLLSYMLEFRFARFALVGGGLAIIGAGVTLIVGLLFASEPSPSSSGSPISPTPGRVSGETFVLNGTDLSVDGYAIRLNGISAISDQAKDTLASLVGNTQLWCVVTHLDADGFGYADCSSIRYEDLGVKLVHAGMARATNDDYLVVESGARTLNIGAWE